MSEVEGTPTRRLEGPSGLFWVVSAAAVVVLVAFRLHALDLPLETDECNYAYIGGRLLSGDRLYVDVWDHQPFGVFALFGGVIAMFGDGPSVFRWLATASCVMSLALIMGILRRVGSEQTAIVGGLLYAIASSDPGTGGEGCNREIFMNTLILAGWSSSLRAMDSSKASSFSWQGLLLSGGFLALGSTLKTVVAVYWFGLAAWIAWVTCQAPGAERRASRVLASLAVLACGPAVVWFGAFAYFAATGRLTEFVDAVFLFNVGYTESGEPFWMRFVRFFAPIRHPYIFDSGLAFWVAAIPATLWLASRSVKKPRHLSASLFLLLISSFLAACLPGRFWPHYYCLLIPPAVMVVSLMAEAVANSVTQPLGVGSGGKRLVGYVIRAVIPLLVLGTQVRDYLLQPPFGITVKRYNSRDFWGKGQGENVASVTDPSDTVFVFGNDASIYYYAKRRCASRFTMITGLMKGMRGAEERRRVLIRELRASPPRLIVVLFDEHPFAEWKQFLDEHYGQPVGWDFHDRSGEPIMFVLARKDRPIREIDWNWDRSSVGGWQLGDRR